MLRRSGLLVDYGGYFTSIAITPTSALKPRVVRTTFQSYATVGVSSVPPNLAEGLDKFIGFLWKNGSSLITLLNDGLNEHLVRNERPR